MSHKSTFTQRLCSPVRSGKFAAGLGNNLLNTGFAGVGTYADTQSGMSVPEAVVNNSPPLIGSALSPLIWGGLSKGLGQTATNGLLGPAGWALALGDVADMTKQYYSPEGMRLADWQPESLPGQIAWWSPVVGPAWRAGRNIAHASGWDMSMAPRPQAHRDVLREHIRNNPGQATAEQYRQFAEDQKALARAGQSQAAQYAQPAAIPGGAHHAIPTQLQEQATPQPQVPAANYSQRMPVRSPYAYTPTDRERLIAAKQTGQQAVAQAKINTVQPRAPAPKPGLTPGPATPKTPTPQLAAGNVA